MEPQLFPLKEEIEDGAYLAEDYVPRMLFSYNNVVLTELLQKVEENQESESNTDVIEKTSLNEKNA